MTARLPELRLLAPADLLAAAERILAAPTYNVQRVSMDEVYTFAVATTQLCEICTLVAADLSGRADDAGRARLRGHLHALGFLPASFAPPPSHPREEITSHG